MVPRPILAVITSVSSIIDGDRLTLDSKALSGMRAYASQWPGEVKWLSTLSKEALPYSETVLKRDLPFEFLPVAADRSDVGRLIMNADIVLASGDDVSDLHLAAIAPGKVVFVIEYTLRTRLKILRLGSPPIHKFLRGVHWLLFTELRRRRAFRLARGIQANGVPAFESYKKLNASTLLYFDTRLDSDQQIDNDELCLKFNSIISSRVLRLVYSGRLIRMKGADYLIPLALELQKRGITFQIDIFGDGEERENILLAIAEYNLDKIVIFHGAVSFSEELVPELKRNSHLFLCLHPQGDPSCTYLETLGCGVPIAGFANEALAGMLQLGDWGCSVPIGNIGALADQIQILNVDRQRLARMCEAAVEFSSSRSASAVFAERIAQLRKMAAV